MRLWPWAIVAAVAAYVVVSKNTVPTRWLGQQPGGFAWVGAERADRLRADQKIVEAARREGRLEGQLALCEAEGLKGGAALDCVAEYDRDSTRLWHAPDDQLE